MSLHIPVQFFVHDLCQKVFKEKRSSLFMASAMKKKYFKTQTSSFKLFSFITDVEAK